MSALGLRRRRWRSVRRPKYRGFHFVRNEWLVTTVSRETEGTNSGPKRASSRSLGYRSGGSFLSREGPSTARPRTRPNRSSWLWPPVLVRRSGRCRGYCPPQSAGSTIRMAGFMAWERWAGQRLAATPIPAKRVARSMQRTHLPSTIRSGYGWAGLVRIRVSRETAHSHRLEPWDVHKLASIVGWPRDLDKKPARLHGRIRSGIGCISFS